MSTLLQVKGLTKRFTVGRRGFKKVQLTAVEDVSFDIDQGETLGLVGESGSGKSTTGLMIGRLLEPDAGTVTFEGRDLLSLRGSELRRERQKFQTIFQDPYTSLNPRLSIEDIVSEPLRTHQLVPEAERRDEVMRWLTLVGLSDPRYLDRRPSQFSGGQRQRIAIARALACSPKFVIADEVVAALDVSTQSGVVNLLQDIQESMGLAVLFISHDLSVVRHVSDRIAVMFRGRIVEAGPAEEICSDPQHPYTRALLDSVLRPNPALQRLRARPPRRTGGALTGSSTRGCPFYERCPDAMDICAEVDPARLDLGGGHSVRCHLHDPSRAAYATKNEE